MAQLPPFGSSDFPTVNYKTVVLERLKVAAQRTIGPQMLHDLKFETYTDEMLGRLVLQLSTYVVAHKEDQQDVRVPFERSETLDVPGPRRFLWTFLLASIVGLVLAMIAQSWPAVVLSVLFAAAWVIVHAANPPTSVTATAKGEAVISRTLYQTFPENTMVFPDHLGRPVEYVQTTYPTVSYED